MVSYKTSTVLYLLFKNAMNELSRARDVRVIDYC